MPMWYVFSDNRHTQLAAEAGRRRRDARARCELADRTDRDRGRLRRLGQQAYEYVSPGTKARRERWFIFTKQGAKTIIGSRTPVQRLLPHCATFDRRLLRKDLRAL